MPKKKKLNGLEEIPKPVNTEENTTLNEVEKKAFSLNPEVNELKGSKPRLTITLHPEGGVDWDSMRADTVNRFKEALRDPKTLAALGADASKLPEIISDQEIEMLYGMISTLEAFAFNMAGKIDFDIAQKHARLDAKQIELLTPPTKNVIIKHMDADSFLFKWKDEIVLSVLLLTITRAKYEGARREQSLRNEEKERENPATQAVEAPIQ